MQGVTYMLDKLDAAQVKIVFGICFQDSLIVDAAGSDACVPIQLGTAPDEWQKLVVIQPPDPM